MLQPHETFEVVVTKTISRSRLEIVEALNDVIEAEIGDENLLLAGDDRLTKEFCVEYCAALAELDSQGEDGLCSDDEYNKFNIKMCEKLGYKFDQ